MEDVNKGVMMVSLAHCVGSWVSRGEPVGNLQYALDLQELFDSELTKQQKQDE